MKLPYAIVKDIIALPEGKPTSFSVHTDGKKIWKLELHKQLQEEEAQLMDLNLLWKGSAHDPRKN